MLLSRYTGVPQDQLMVLLPDPGTRVSVVRFPPVIFPNPTNTIPPMPGGLVYTVDPRLGTLSLWQYERDDRKGYLTDFVDKVLQQKPAVVSVGVGQGLRYRAGDRSMHVMGGNDIPITWKTLEGLLVADDHVGNSLPFDLDM